MVILFGIKKNYFVWDYFVAVEEEGSEYGHQDHRSRASSISNSEVVAEGKKAGKKPRKDKEKGGIFKGLGSMFR